MKVEWSQDALADLDRFAAFLHDKYPSLAPRVAQEIKAKAQSLADFPQSGRPLAGRDVYRQIVLEVLNARYVFQYRYDGERLVILRVFHGREARE
ncbi:MAG: type II toxin-antitoxin system RelE/ParE family toxin [Xanthobacteraceae bacterium]